MSLQRRNCQRSIGSKGSSRRIYQATYMFDMRRNRGNKGTYVLKGLTVLYFGELDGREFLSQHFTEAKDLLTSFVQCGSETLCRIFPHLS